MGQARLEKLLSQRKNDAEKPTLNAALASKHQTSRAPMPILSPLFCSPPLPPQTSPPGELLVPPSSPFLHPPAPSPLPPSDVIFAPAASLPPFLVQLLVSMLSPPGTCPPLPASAAVGAITWPTVTSTPTVQTTADCSSGMPTLTRRRPHDEAAPSSRTRDRPRRCEGGTCGESHSDVEDDKAESTIPPARKGRGTGEEAEANYSEHRRTRSTRTSMGPPGRGAKLAAGRKRPPGGAAGTPSPTRSSPLCSPASSPAALPPVSPRLQPLKQTSLPPLPPPVPAVVSQSPQLPSCRLSSLPAPPLPYAPSRSESSSPSAGDIASSLLCPVAVASAALSLSPLEATPAPSSRAAAGEASPSDTDTTVTAPDRGGGGDEPASSEAASLPAAPFSSPQSGAPPTSDAVVCASAASATLSASHSFEDPDAVSGLRAALSAPPNPFVLPAAASKPVLRPKGHFAAKPTARGVLHARRTAIESPRQPAVSPSPPPPVELPPASPPIGASQPPAESTSLPPSSPPPAIDRCDYAVSARARVATGPTEGDNDAAPSAQPTRAAEGGAAIEQAEPRAAIPVSAADSTALDPTTASSTSCAALVPSHEPSAPGVDATASAITADAANSTTAEKNAGSPASLVVVVPLGERTAVDTDASVHAVVRAAEKSPMQPPQLVGESGRALSRSTGTSGARTDMAMTTPTFHAPESIVVLPKAAPGASTKKEHVAPESSAASPSGSLDTLCMHSTTPRAAPTTSQLGALVQELASPSGTTCLRDDNMAVAALPNCAAAPPLQLDEPKPGSVSIHLATAHTTPPSTDTPSTAGGSAKQAARVAETRKKHAASSPATKPEAPISPSIPVWALAGRVTRAHPDPDAERVLFEHSYKLRTSHRKHARGDEAALSSTDRRRPETGAAKQSAHRLAATASATSAVTTPRERTGVPPSKAAATPDVGRAAEQAAKRGRVEPHPLKADGMVTPDAGSTATQLPPLLPTPPQPTAPAVVSTPGAPPLSLGVLRTEARTHGRDAGMAGSGEDTAVLLEHRDEKDGPASADGRAPSESEGNAIDALEVECMPPSLPAPSAPPPPPSPLARSLRALPHCSTVPPSDVAPRNQLAAAANGTVMSEQAETELRQLEHAQLGPSCANVGSTVVRVAAAAESGSGGSTKISPLVTATTCTLLDDRPASPATSSASVAATCSTRDGPSTRDTTAAITIAAEGGREQTSVALPPAQSTDTSAATLSTAAAPALARSGSTASSAEGAHLELPPPSRGAAPTVSPSARPVDTAQAILSSSATPASPDATPSPRQAGIPIPRHALSPPHGSSPSPPQPTPCSAVPPKSTLSPPATTLPAAAIPAPPSAEAAGGQQQQACQADDADDAGTMATTVAPASPPSPPAPSTPELTLATPPISILPLATSSAIPPVSASPPPAIEPGPPLPTLTSPSSAAADVPSLAASASGAPADHDAPSSGATTAVVAAAVPASLLFPAGLRPSAPSATLVRRRATRARAGRGGPTRGGAHVFLRGNSGAGDDSGVHDETKTLLPPAADVNDVVALHAEARSEPQSLPLSEKVDQQPAVTAGGPAHNDTGQSKDATFTSSSALLPTPTAQLSRAVQSQPLVGSAGNSTAAEASPVVNAAPAIHAPSGCDAAKHATGPTAEGGHVVGSEGEYAQEDSRCSVTLLLARLAGDSGQTSAPRRPGTPEASNCSAATPAPGTPMAGGHRLIIEDDDDDDDGHANGAVTAKSASSPSAPSLPSALARLREALPRVATLPGGAALAEQLEQAATRRPPADAPPDAAALWEAELDVLVGEAVRVIESSPPPRLLQPPLPTPLSASLPTPVPESQRLSCGQTATSATPTPSSSAAGVRRVVASASPFASPMFSAATQLALSSAAVPTPSAPTTLLSLDYPAGVPLATRRARPIVPRSLKALMSHSPPSETLMSGTALPPLHLGTPGDMSGPRLGFRAALSLAPAFIKDTTAMNAVLSEQA